VILCLQQVMESHTVVRTSMLPHFLHNRLTDDGEISITRRPAVLYLRKIPSRHFCYILNRPQGHNATGKIRSIEKSHDLMENVNRYIPACSMVLELAALKKVIPVVN
jgi:hypothetical protein